MVEMGKLIKYKRTDNIATVRRDVGTVRAVVINVNDGNSGQTSESTLARMQYTCYLSRKH